MSQTKLTGLTRKKLRRWLLLFFLALAIPTAILIQRAYSELKWESFHLYRLQAEELAARIDTLFVNLIDKEEVRSFADYAFLNVSGDTKANFVQRSPLSSYPVASAIPGLIGYFQVDAHGMFSTPLLPLQGASSASYGISQSELQQRTALADRIQKILSENRLVQNEEVRSGNQARPDLQARQKQKRDNAPAMSAPAVLPTDDMVKGQMLEHVPGRLEQESIMQQSTAQTAFDQLKKESALDKLGEKKALNKLGRVKDLKLDYRYQTEPAEQLITTLREPRKRLRKETSALPESVDEAFADEIDSGVSNLSGLRIRTFESEIDPFEVSLLDSGHFVLFRKVWRDGQRYIQGALIEQHPLLDEVVGATFEETVLSQMSDLIVAYQGNVFKVFNGQASRDYLSSTQELSGAVLHQVRLSTPLSDMQLIFNIRHLPVGAGASVITWAATVMIIVLCAGFYLLYRLAARQIDLVRQQQDFVSAVSHELKTPLTSIRMYGELLREGWASDEKKKTYYDYIYDESERLSRLINNVLQLARMTRNEIQVNLENVTVAEIMDNIRSKVSSQIEQAGFKLIFSCDQKALQAVIRIDADSFTQVLINLVDNAIKFSAKAEKKQIEINCRLERSGKLLFAIRDYGSGISQTQMKKIFSLFYRSENELTRETVGTGIGLALVQQLVLVMHGEVDVVNKTPGAEFRVRFTIEK